MRTIETDDPIDEIDGIAAVDHRGSPDEVLNLVDGQLAAFGLEIVLYNTGDDTYAWRIEKRAGA